MSNEYTEELDEDLVEEDVKEDFDSLMGKSGSGLRNSELEEWADQILKADSNREICRKCKESGVNDVAYGETTGFVYPMPQFTKQGDPVLDDEGEQLIVDFDELECENGHRWFRGEGMRRRLDGKNPILFESHLHNRRRREIYNSLGAPDPSIVAGMYNRCVDTWTTALTPKGWMNFDELQIGDKIWSYDINSDQFRWEVLQDVYIQPFAGELYSYESQNISALVSEGHKWAVVHERDKDTKVIAQSGSSLTDRHYIVLPHGEITHDTVDPLFELLGWVITDGSYKNNRTDCVVYQSLNNPKVVALQACLRANGVNDEVNYIDENNVGRWRIQSEVGKKLREIAPVKLLTSVDLDSYTDLQYASLMRGVISGDGYVRELPSGYSCREVYSTKLTEAKAIQALATRLNVPSKCRYTYNEDAFCVEEYAVNMKNSAYAYVRAANKGLVEYEGEIWCPQVATGFWVASRKGTTYVTGNTHPQGRKVNSAEQRKKNGASYYR